MLEILYHKRNPLFTKTESQTNSNKMKTCIFSKSRRKLLMILILVQNVHERKDTYLRWLA